MNKEDADRYHAHLDSCEQCREHPFKQCPIGRILLMATAIRNPPKIRYAGH